MALLRLDYIFSYWIFAFFILYEMGLIKYSPKFLLIIGVIHNFLLLIYFIVRKSSSYDIIKFITINIFIKIIPLYLVWKDKIIKKDIIASFIIFLIFLFWMFINKQFNTTFNEYTKLVKGYTSSKINKDQTFLSYAYDELYKKYFISINNK